MEPNGAQWSIENTLHQVLEVCRNEDNCRSRKDHAPAYIAALTRSIRKCAWNDQYLLKALSPIR